MVLNSLLEKLRKGLLIFKISFLIILSCCSDQESADECITINIGVNTLLKNVVDSTRKNLVIKDIVKANELYEGDVVELEREGFYKVSCLQMTKLQDGVYAKLIDGKNLNPDLFQKNVIYEIAEPYQKDDGTIAIIITEYCGTDCGSVDLYMISNKPEGWSVESIKNLAVM